MKVNETIFVDMSFYSQRGQHKLRWADASLRVREATTGEMQGFCALSSAKASTGYWYIPCSNGREIKQKCVPPSAATADLASKFQENGASSTLSVGWTSYHITDGKHRRLFPCRWLLLRGSMTRLTLPANQTYFNPRTELYTKCLLVVAPCYINGAMIDRCG